MRVTVATRNRTRALEPGLSSSTGEKPKFNEYRQYGEQAASTLIKKKTARSRHGRFGSKTIYSHSFQRSGKDQTTQLRKYYGARVFENSHESSLPSCLNERSKLAELARTLLVDGGFNEVVYVAWDHIRQRDMIVCNDEDQLNIHSFFALSQFFVTFVSLSFDWNITDISKSYALSNLFDKHLFFWLRKKWEMFDHSKVRALYCRACLRTQNVPPKRMFEACFTCLLSSRKC
mmetsp:Transcript_13708/g.55448  ORF Transcript_13708/g.55448 Transcript_13708/m.55448 type:complete len:232 (+) Transcript_13708:812-1507(+)